MANHKSAEKRARQNVVRNARNRARKSRIKTIVRTVETAIKAADTANITDNLRRAESSIARAAQKKTMHWRTASRKISRLAKKVAAVKKAG